MTFKRGSNKKNTRRQVRMHDFVAVIAGAVAVAYAYHGEQDRFGTRWQNRPDCVPELSCVWASRLRLSARSIDQPSSTNALNSVHTLAPLIHNFESTVTTFNDPAIRETVHRFSEYRAGRIIWLKRSTYARQPLSEQELVLSASPAGGASTNIERVRRWRCRAKEMVVANTYNTRYDRGGSPRWRSATDAANAPTGFINARRRLSCVANGVRMIAHPILRFRYARALRRYVRYFIAVLKPRPNTAWRGPQRRSVPLIRSIVSSAATRHDRAGAKVSAPPARSGTG